MVSGAVSVKNHSGLVVERGRQRVDTRYTRPLSFGEMSHTKVKHDCTQKNRADDQMPLKSAKQHTGLELDQLKAKVKQEASQPRPQID